ncbi:hypothetical protein GCM10009780_37290 [Actinomadura alba]
MAGQPRRRREISDESREAIRRSVAAAPRLVPEQIATLRAIFQGGAAENPQRAA